MTDGWSVTSRDKSTITVWKMDYQLSPGDPQWDFLKNKKKTTNPCCWGQWAPGKSPVSLQVSGGTFPAPACGELAGVPQGQGSPGLHPGPLPEPELAGASRSGLWPFQRSTGPCPARGPGPAHAVWPVGAPRGPGRFRHRRGAEAQLSALSPCSSSPAISGSERSSHPHRSDSFGGNIISLGSREAVRLVCLRAARRPQRKDFSRTLFRIRWTLAKPAPTAGSSAGCCH